MADYKTLHGTHIEAVASDPSNPVTGQVWYNTTSNVMKGFTSNPTGAWAAGNNMNTARRQAAGAGIQTSALVFGGYSTAKEDKAESYDGTSWTEVGDLNGAKNLLAGCGASNTAGLAFGGLSPASPATVGITESFNGTSWTEVADLNTNRGLMTGMGTATAALAAAGYDTANYAIAESWNGTAWTEVGDLNTARRGAAAAKQSSTAGLVFGGFITAVSALNEAWNGTSWTEVGDLNTASAFKAGAGTQASAMAVAGSRTVPAAMATEEYTFPVETSETITTS